MTKCGVKWLDIDGKFLFCVFMDREEAEVHKLAKKEQGQYPAILIEQTWSIYLLLTEFEIRTVSYRPSFSLQFMTQARSAQAINRREKWRSVTYSMDQEDEVSKIFIISLLCVWRAQQWFPFMRNSLKFLKQVESKTNQFEILTFGTALK